MLKGRLLFATLSHSIFSQYGDIMAACLNLMNTPIKSFFRASLSANYGSSDDNSVEKLFAICASSMFLGLMVSFIIMGKLMDGFGRKETIIFRSFLGIIGSLLMFGSHLINRFELYIIGHFISGLLSGLRIVLIIWVAECSPASKRGLTSLFINSGGVIMVLFFTPLCLPSVFGNDQLWFMLPVLTALLATIHLIITIFLPNSPKQLFIRDKNEVKARKSLRFYYGDDKAAIEEAVIEMDNENKKTSDESLSFIDILQHKTHRFSFLIVFVCSLIPVFSGLNIKSQYLVDILSSYGLHQTEATIALMAISLISLPVSFISPIIIHKYGRRPIFVTIAWCCVIEWIGFSIAQLLNDLHIDTPLQWIIAGFSSILGQSALNMGMLVMAPIMISELCPHNIRATVSQFTQAPPIGIAVLEVLMFPTLRASYGAAMFLFLATCCAALAVILNNQMIETAHTEFEEIIKRMGSQEIIRRSNTSVGLIHYGSMWERDCDVKYEENYKKSKVHPIMDAKIF